MDEKLICIKCSAINNWCFVMYYGDACFNCNFDIREHKRKKWGWYDAEEQEEKEHTCPHFDVGFVE